jgi:drug/metabolite transporter (DMT)-like permease
MNRGIVYAFCAALLWGLDYSIAEKVFIKTSIYTLLFFEMLSGLVILGVLGYSDIKRDLTAGISYPLTAVCCVIFNAAMICIAKSIVYSNATIAGLIEISYPFFIIIASYFLFKQNHLSISVIIGGILIFSGILTIYIFKDGN